jgi:hypothetical protein
LGPLINKAAASARMPVDEAINKAAASVQTPVDEPLGKAVNAAALVDLGGSWGTALGLLANLKQTHKVK